eukprot:COSAG02_NODE_5764_length_4058_cov_1.871937_5_plen_146_part_00
MLPFLTAGSSRPPGRKPGMHSPNSLPQRSPVGFENTGSRILLAATSHPAMATLHDDQSTAPGPGGGQQQQAAAEPAAGQPTAPSPDESEEAFCAPLMEAADVQYALTSAPRPAPRSRASPPPPSEADCRPCTRAPAAIRGRLTTH